MGKRALKNQSKVSVSPLYPTVSFTGLRLNSPHQRSFQNLFLMTPSQPIPPFPHTPAITSCPSFTRKRSMSSMLTTIRTQSPSQY